MSDPHKQAEDILTKMHVSVNDITVAAMLAMYNWTLQDAASVVGAYDDALADRVRSLSLPHESK